MRIDVFIRQAVRRWQLAGQNPEDPFRGLYITDEKATQLAHHPLASSWGAEVSLPEDEKKRFVEEELALEKQSRDFVAQAQAAGVALRLPGLAELFRLSPFEYAALLVCLAPSIDLRYERLFGYLQDDITCKNPSPALIMELLLPPGPERLNSLTFFSEQATLLRFGLIKPLDEQGSDSGALLRREFAPAPELVAWLLGDYIPAKELQSFVRLHLAPSMEGWAWLKEDIEFDLNMIKEHAPLLVFYGADQERHRAAAFRIARYLSSPILEINLESWKSTTQAGGLPLNLILRDAALTGSLPFFTHWECILDGEGVAPVSILDELSWFTDPMIISSAGPWRLSSTHHLDYRPVFWQSFDLPNTAQRLALWRESLEDQPGITLEELEALAGQFILSSAQILDATRSAHSTALQLGRSLQAYDLYEAARLHSTHHLDTLAVKIQPRYRWEDIVLPADELAMLHEIAGTVRGQALVLDEWGLGQKLVASRGVSALFAGQPGTGKTLAAQVIAAELGMDLYKIDLSTVVSKYIGETEKNLERIFSQANNSNAILFFDEADAIFGKRSEVKDAHDRYANIEVGYLLQRMESYDGVVVLATNLRSNLDEAFTRRLQFIVDFPFPNEEQRLNIWKVLFPKSVPCADDLDFIPLAKRFKLSGGAIRNTIVSAAFLAAGEGKPVGMRHLMHSLRREMQKMGRLVDESEFQIPINGGSAGLKGERFGT